MMKTKQLMSSAAAIMAAATIGTQVFAEDGDRDFGVFVQQQLAAHAEQLFGVNRVLRSSALGPFTGADSAAAIELAGGLQATVVSTATHPSADMIAMWPCKPEATESGGRNPNQSGQKQRGGLIARTT